MMVRARLRISTTYGACRRFTRWLTAIRARNVLGVGLLTVATGVRHAGTPLHVAASATPIRVTEQQTAASGFAIVVGGSPAQDNIPYLNELGIRLVRHSFNWGRLMVDPTMVEAHGVKYAAHHIDVLANVAYLYPETIRPQAFPGDAAYRTCRDLTPGSSAACIPLGGRDWTVARDAFKPGMKRAMVAARNSVRYWSFGNEANEYDLAGKKAFFAGTDAQFDTLSRLFCDAVREVRAEYGADVLCVGPEAGVSNDPTQRMAALRWVQARDVAAHFDVIAIHVYDWHDGVRATAQEARALLQKPIWITETGLPTPTYRPSASDPEFQERDVVAKAADVQHRSQTDSGYERIFYFDLVSNVSGLLNVSNRAAPRRPAYWALRHQLAGQYRTPAPGLCSSAVASTPVACDYLVNAPSPGYEDWHCVMRARVTRNGRPVQGVAVLGYRGIGQFGTKQTNAGGIASFNSLCGAIPGHDGGLRIVATPARPQYTDGIIFAAGVHDQTFDFTLP